MTANSVYEILADAEETLLEFLNENSEIVFNPELLGLDRRCGMLRVGDSFIATKGREPLDYYGGFEYINKEDILVLGSWTIYTDEAGRVENALEIYRQRKETSSNENAD